MCVTRENQSARWLNFEAGALAKAVESSRVVPLAIDLKPSDIEPPLGHFQAQPATEEGVRAITRSLNTECSTSLDGELLERSFSKWWPDLDAKLQQIAEVSPSPVGGMRTERELLEETLDTVRGLARQNVYEWNPPETIEVDFSKLGPPPKDFAVGELVRHPEFGDGIVTGVEPGGVVIVRFGSGRERRLSAQHAPLTRP